MYGENYIYYRYVGVVKGMARITGKITFRCMVRITGKGRVKGRQLQLNVQLDIW